MDPRKVNRIKLPMNIMGFVLMMMICSLVTIAFGEQASVDYDLKPKITELLDISSTGHLQSVSTTMIGPFMTIKLKFFKENNQLVSANAYQFFWFEPQITCVSGSPNHLCS